MERIREALAKARAERDALMAEQGAQQAPGADSGTNRAPTAPGTTGNDGTPSSISAAWDALPTLTVDPRRAARNHLVALVGGTGAAEIDGIRTRLLQHINAKGFCKVAIISPTPGAGKTTLALNLGFSLGRQSEQRTIVADADLRRPQMAKVLGVPAPHCFDRVLDGTATFAENAVRVGGNLAFATTHGPVRHSAELLQSQRARAALNAIQAAYAPTVMLFELPPVLASDDAMAFLGHMDCALIIAAAERNSTREVDRCERDVASRTTVLGVVLNRCRYMDRADGYSSYYGR
jgi:Mrp family chromosome partitioning ATPase